MLLIGDDDSARRTVPLVTYGLIALNVVFFMIELTSGDAFIGKRAFFASRFLANPLADRWRRLYGAHRRICGGVIIDLFVSWESRTAGVDFVTIDLADHDSGSGSFPDVLKD